MRAMTLLMALSMFAVAHLDEKGIAQGIVRVLIKAGVQRRLSDDAVTVVVLHMEGNAADAARLAHKIEDAALLLNLKPAKCSTTSLGIGSARFELEAIRRAAPSSVVAYNLPATVVSDLSTVMGNTRILTITTRPDDVAMNRVSIAVTGANAIVRSNPALAQQGYSSLTIGADVATPVAGRDWRLAYEHGRRALETFRPRPADWELAARYMQDAVAARSLEREENTRREGVSSDPVYVPHFFLGVAYFHLGRCDDALREFTVSEKSGAIKAWSEKYDELQRLKEECRKRGRG